MQIRPFMEKDRQNIRDICVETCLDKNLTEQKIKLLYLLYADYYMDYEADHLFVGVDDNDNCVGYILCAPNPKRFASIFKSEYLTQVEQLNPEQAKQQRIEIFLTSLFNCKYPAHLHIDLSEKAQRQGLGTKLMNTLLTKLQSEKVKGIRLGCSRFNEKGVNFYTKYGFKRLFTTSDSILFGLDLRKFRI